MGIVLNAAVKKKLLPYSPMRGTEPIRVTNKRVDLDLPSEDEVKNLLDFAQEAQQKGLCYEHTYELLLLFASTGLRDGEGYGLQLKYVSKVHVKVKGIDTIKGLIKVRTQQTPFGTTEPLKKPASYRDIYVEEFVVDKLLALPVINGFVFNKDDHHPTRASFDKYMSSFFDLAGCPPTYTVYTFRHFHATMLLKHGVNIKQVSKRMGHKNAAVTLNMYAHYLSEEDAVAASVLCGLYGA